MQHSSSTVQYRTFLTQSLRESGLLQVWNLTSGRITSSIAVNYEARALHSILFFVINTGYNSRFSLVGIQMVPVKFEEHISYFCRRRLSRAVLCVARSAWALAAADWCSLNSRKCRSRALFTSSECSATP